MNGMNGLLIIVIGIVVIAVIVGNRGACLGGAFSCLFSGPASTSMPATGTNLSSLRSPLAGQAGF